MSLSLLVAQAGTVFARDTNPITGIVQDIILETDTTTGKTAVLVTLATDDTGTTQTLRLPLETAEALGLVTIDLTTGEVSVNADAIGTSVEIDPASIISDDGETDEAQHPVGSALADFFSELLGVDYDTIMEYHGDGVGFGVIAQALWMTSRLEGDTETFQMILDAKQSGDYSAITLPDGSTPQNWGQFKKAVMGTGKKENLGTVMSGRTDAPAETTVQDRSNGNRDKDKDRGKDKSNKGKGKDR